MLTDQRCTEDQLPLIVLVRTFSLTRSRPNRAYALKTLSCIPRSHISPTGRKAFEPDFRVVWTNQGVRNPSLLHASPPP